MFFIALCGPPKSGKSLVQKILYNKWDVMPIDDGRILRDAVKNFFGISEEDVSTQEGKQKLYNLEGANGEQNEWTNRQLLGKFARGLEKEFGDFLVPLLTVRGPCNNSQFNRFSFGSVRRNQGWFYKKQGIVVEVRRDLKTDNNFDLYDRDAVDYVLNNNGTIEDLKKQIDELLKDVVESHPRIKKSLPWQRYKQPGEPLTRHDVMHGTDS